MIFQHSQACDLKILLLIRFLFDYHINVFSSRLRILSKVYRVFVLICVLSSNLINKTVVFDYTHWSYLVEYVIYFIISWRTKEKCVLQFYRRLLIIDTLPCADNLYKKLSKFLLFALLTSIFYRITSIILYCIYMNIPVSFGLCMYAIVGVMRDLGPFNAVLTFSIIYIRLNIVRRTIETKGFKHINAHKYSSRNYIKMYEILADSISNIDSSLKFMVHFWNDTKLFNFIYFSTNNLVFFCLQMFCTITISVPRTVIRYYSVISYFKVYVSSKSIIIVIANFE